MPVKYLTVEEVASRLAVHTKTVRKLIKEGKIAAVKVAGRLRVSEVALAAYLASSEVKRPAPKQVPALKPPSFLKDGFKYL